MRKKGKYTEAVLRECMEEFEATLDESSLVLPLTCNHKITFTCKCGEFYTKGFYNLLKGGAVCLPCSRLIGAKKLSETLIATREAEGLFIYNKTNLLLILEQANATLVSDVEEKIHHGDMITFICKCGDEYTKNYTGIRKVGAYCSKCVRKKEIADINKKKADEKRDIIKKDNPGKLKCGQCGKIKSEELFSFKKNSNIERRTFCIECVKNDEKRLDNISDIVMKIKKEKGPCVDCGEDNVHLLQFDHIDSELKEGNVGSFKNIEKIQAEADKCEMRCIICHVRRTKEQCNWKKTSLHEYVDNIKIIIGGCELCGWFDETLLEALHFDHLDRTTKKNDVSYLVVARYSKEIIDTEIAKCRLLCAHCHLIHTKEQCNHIDNSINPKNEVRQSRQNQDLILLTDPLDNEISANITMDDLNEEVPNINMDDLDDEVSKITMDDLDNDLDDLDNIYWD